MRRAFQVVPFIASLVVATLVAGCGGATASAGPTTRLASTAAEFSAEHCLALQSLFRGYGNPDTAGLSPMMQAFQAAIERGDPIASATQAAALKAEFERGREHARIGAGWPPGAVAMSHVDTLLVAFERMVDAEQGAMAQGPSAAKQAGQAAFEAAGGIDAWYAWLQAAKAAVDAGAKLGPCEGVPIS